MTVSLSQDTFASLSFLKSYSAHWERFKVLELGERKAIIPGTPVLSRVGLEDPEATSAASSINLDWSESEPLHANGFRVLEIQRNGKFEELCKDPPKPGEKSR